MFAHIRSDLRAYNGKWWEQGFWAMVVYRFGRWRYGIRPALVRKPFSLLYKIAHKFTQIITGIDLPCEVEVGKNFVIDHFGGIIVSGYTRFGDNCRIRNNVCIGLRHVEEPVAPVIGNNVDIGTGAKLLGPITIGDNVLIGANAVVITDVPSNSIAIGVPAVIKPRKPRLAGAPSRRIRRERPDSVDRSELTAARTALAVDTSPTPLP
jgi:serine O-acetyltransferase